MATTRRKKGTAMPPMTPTEADEFLMSFWRARVQYGKQQVWTNTATGKKRGPEAEPITPDELAKLRAAYLLLPPDRQRAAWNGYQRNGVLLADDPPGAVRTRFELGEGDIFTGWDIGQTWNGWRCPLLDAKEAKRLCEHLTASWAETDTEPHTWVFDEARGVIVETSTYDGEVEIQEHEASCTTLAAPVWDEEEGDEVIGLPLYDCAFGLCWTIAEEAK